MALTTPSPSPAPHGIARLDVPLAEVAADVARLADRRYRECQLADLAHVMDANYRHCATDHPELIPDSDWQPGGGPR